MTPRLRKAYTSPRRPCARAGPARWCRGTRWAGRAGHSPAADRRPRPSHPIVWWSPKLALSEPDWIGERPGSDVLGSMFWIPFVTFWQVTADLPFSTGVPDGHGHTYKSAYAYAWNAAMWPDGFTAQDLDRLRDIVSPPK
ncbi:alpha/beta-hydrolase family protein [Streptomyces sp. NBC_01443]|uniref:alpha/beta-hydrolase family protein n=1 Tax=Streptomyces sp. NBC_01443 TaxID=2903868 RepID=UPI0022563C16|nr:alpha/beta-hydrolase family protein [Streptomyces sp. NBC_01443]MCX4626228.1 alpha/beta-hydrolase family protein [Streptomyces sp. NBC_01443]